MPFVAIAARSYDTWRMRWILTVLVVFAAAILPGRAAAFDLEENLRQTHAQYAGFAELYTVQAGCLSLGQATEQVRRRTGGKVISAQTRVQGGRDVHYIKVLKDGKVKTHRVNGCKRR